MKHMRILVVMHPDLMPPESLEGFSEAEMMAWKTEYDVVTTLRELGHEVEPLGIDTDLNVLRNAIIDFKPHMTFNLLEEFHGYALFDQHIVSYLELMKQKYTGCNPRGLTLAHDKALSKKLLAYHRIHVPRFAVFALGQRFVEPTNIRYPLLVKSLIEEGSIGIAHASIVPNAEKLRERVEFVHRQTETHAIAEEYIDGRELYVGVIGNKRLEVFTIWEMFFKNLPADAPRIATGRIKWDLKYRQRAGIDTGPAAELSNGMRKRIIDTCRRIYRALSLTGYARMDLRLTKHGDIYLLEANPNPDLSYGEDFAESAEQSGISYENLLERIVRLGLRYEPVSMY